MITELSVFGQGVPIGFVRMSRVTMKATGSDSNPKTTRGLAAGYGSGALQR